MKFVIIAAVSIFWLVGCNNFLAPQPLKNKTKENPLAKNSEQTSAVKLEATYESIKANIIDKKCLSCHKAGTGKKGEDLPFETKEQIINGTSVDGKPLIVQGKAIESPMYLVLLEDKALRGKLKLMPPVKAIEEKIVEAVTKDEVDVLAAWINGTVVVPEKSDIKIDEKDKSTVIPVEVEPKKDDLQSQQTSQEQIVKPEVVIKDNLVDFALIKSKILDVKCIKCHKVGGKSEELPFETKQDVLIGTNDIGESIIIPGKPESSLLYLSLLPNEADRKGARKMPTSKSVQAGDVQDITPEETKLIEAWIKNGAP
jgi:uncharacterized membrane protein